MKAILACLRAYVFTYIFVMNSHFSHYNLISNWLLCVLNMHLFILKILVILEKKNIWLLTTKFPGQNTVRRGRIHSSVEGMNASNFIHKFIQELKAFISKSKSPYNNWGAWWWTHKELKRKNQQQKICQNHSLKYHEDCCLFM